MKAHEPTNLGWFTNTSSPKADIPEWCGYRPNMRIEVGPPMVSDETYSEDEMRKRGIVGLYVVAWKRPVPPCDPDLAR
jgi:hypothetical protein